MVTKINIGVDAEYGLIRRYRVTDVSVHDSHELGNLLDDDNKANTLWADSAYRSEVTEAVLELMGFDSQIHERPYRNRPLSDEQHSNRTKSKTRAKVEHVFGTWTMQMGGKLVRSIGIVGAKAQLGLKNLTYNLIRYTFLQTQAAG